MHSRNICSYQEHLRDHVARAEGTIMNSTVIYITLQYAIHVVQGQKSHKVLPATLDAHLISEHLSETTDTTV